MKKRKLNISKYNPQKHLKEYTNFQIDQNQFLAELAKFRPRYITMTHAGDNSKIDYSGAISIKTFNPNFKFYSNCFFCETPDHREILEINKRVGKQLGCYDYVIHYKKGISLSLSGISGGY